MRLVQVNDPFHNVRSIELLRAQFGKAVELRKKGGIVLAVSCLALLSQGMKYLFRCLYAYLGLHAGYAGEARQIHGVHNEVQISHEILDMGCFLVAQPPVLLVGYTLCSKICLKLVGLVAGTKEYGNLVCRLCFKQVGYPLCHTACLLNVASALNLQDRFPALSFGCQGLFVAFPGVAHHPVCHLQNGLKGSVVFLKGHNACAGKNLREIKDVAHSCAAEGVNGLRLVAHGHDRTLILKASGQKLEDPCLHKVGVLIFIHKDVAIGCPQHIEGLPVGSQYVL